MADFRQVLEQRRSIRKFEDKEVPEDALTRVLEAAMWSPSWANTQCWEIIVVKDQAQKEAVQASVVKTNPAVKAVANAPVLLVVCGKLGTSGYYKDQVTTKFGDWFMFDLGLACQSMSLAAVNEGLASVIVGLFDHKAAAKAVGVPDGYELVALMPIGYPAKSPSAPKRRAVAEFTHQDKF